MNEEAVVNEEKDDVIEPVHSDNAELPEDKKKGKLSVWVVIPVLVALVFVAGVLTVSALRKFGVINPYEKGYIDTTGRTAGEIAEEKHYKYEKFLKEYGLPEDMPKNTSENAMYNHMPVRILVEKSPEIDSFEQLKEQMGWDDSITEDTPIGEAIDKTQLKYYVGESSLERFKQVYGLSDVTGDTLYGEIRDTVETQQKQSREASGE